MADQAHHHHDTGYKARFSYPEFVQVLIEGFTLDELAQPLPDGAYCPVRIVFVALASMSISAGCKIRQCDGVITPSR